MLALVPSSPKPNVEEHLVNTYEKKSLVKIQWIVSSLHGVHGVNVHASAVVTGQDLALLSAMHNVGAARAETFKEEKIATIQ